MFFSILVPVYNTSEYLPECIDSILSQSFKDYEVILIDDGSTDSSGAICGYYAKRYPDTVRVIHKENEGLLLTRRRGFKEAKGDWFICVDSDDFVSGNLLESVASAVKRFSPDMVMYNYEYVIGGEKKRNSKINIPDKSVFQGENKLFIYEQKLLTNNISNMWSKAIKREILDIDCDYGKSGIRNVCEDEIQALPLFTNAKKIVFLSSPLYYYRKGQKSMTAVCTYENWKAMLICFLKSEEYLDIWNMPEKQRTLFYTRGTEKLSNFLQWAFFSKKSQLEKPVAEIVNDISVHPAFLRCIEMYDKSYASTKYLKFRLPRIIKYVKKRNVRALRLYFRIEKIL